uniref:Putative secreted protein n=1 Tax=Lutzomyia longipalpis TaxID=7200 RepID=A0A1B0CEH3_LUTLO
MWQHRKIILISLILILSLVSMCLKKRKLRHGSEKENLTEIMERSRILKDNLCVDMEANRTNFFYIFCLRRAPFWDSDANGANSISAHGNKIASVIGDKGSGNIQSGRGTLGERRKVKGTEDENNVNSANPVIISCILWLLLSLGKACFEMTNDLKEKIFRYVKTVSSIYIESIQPTSFATNYELMRANEAHRILSMSSFPTTPVLDRRCSVP